MKTVRSTLRARSLAVTMYHDGKPLEEIETECRLSEKELKKLLRNLGVMKHDRRDPEILIARRLSTEINLIPKPKKVKKKKCLMCEEDHG